MARIKKEKEKSNVLLLVLVGIMLFGTIAGGLLFQSPRQEDQPLLTTPPPLTIAPQEDTVTIRHNPVNTTLLTAAGYQTISYDNDSIFVDANHPLAGRNLSFDIRVTNITRANFTGDAKTLAVEEGDVIEVNYTGRLFGGEVFDTSHPEIAGNDSVPKVSWFSARQFYQPLVFTAGSGDMIAGFDEGVRGMKINETKTVEISSEKGYGERDPSLIQLAPIIQSWQKTMQLARKRITYTPEEFQSNFGSVNITEGQVFTVPGTNFNATITYASGNTTIVEMLPAQGEVIRLYEYPWESTITSVTPGQINLEHNIKSGDVVHFPGLPWNSTVL
jgi:FKBP-type peptidyl-prolyl cis-trans isomerase 2